MVPKERYDELQLRLSIAEARNSELEAALKKAEEEKEEAIRMYNEAVRKAFRKSSEVIGDYGQLTFDFEMEAAAAEGAAEEEKENGDQNPVDGKLVRSYIRHKARNAVLSLPADTPITVVYKEAPSACRRCGSALVKTGEKYYDRIVKTTSYSILRTVFPEMKCPECEQDPGEADENEASPDDMLADTICDPSYLAEIVYGKMGLGIPLYRMEASIGEARITRQLISSWMMRAGERIRRNLIPALEKEMLRYPMINVDETTQNVVTLKGPDGKKKWGDSRSNAFVFVRAATDRDGSPGPVIFTYSPDRKNDTITGFLKGFGGIIQTDGLSGYANAEEKLGFTHLGCLVHARRKAVEADVAGKGPAHEILLKYRKIFHAEEILRKEYDQGKLSEKEYLEKRRADLMPLFKELKDFMEKLENSAEALGSRLDTACCYFLKRYDELTRFLDYSFATSSNQRAENAIRPFAAARRSFLFSFTELGAETSAAYYSLVHTCKSLEIDPLDYLTYLFLNGGSAADGDEEGWENLLPGHCDISSAHEYRMKLREAKPDPDRTEPYVLRGKPRRR